MSHMSTTNMITDTSHPILVSGVTHALMSVTHSQSEVWVQLSQLLSSLLPPVFPLLPSIIYSFSHFVLFEQLDINSQR